MHTQENRDNLLWDYIDAHLDKEQHEKVEQLISTNSDWAHRYHTLMELHGLLNKNMELDQPSLRFSANLMDEITKLQIAPATRNYINKRVIRGIGLFFLLLIGGVIVYSIGQIDWSMQGNSSDTISRQISKLNVSSLMSSTVIQIFIIINILLGLMLLDNFLTRKKNLYRNNI